MIIFNFRNALSIITCYMPHNPTIIEVGAFDGNDTVKMTQIWPYGIIHAFEPVDEIYQRLLINTQQYVNVHCHNLALSDTTGTALFYIAEKRHKHGVASQAGSLRKPKDRLVVSPIIFPRTTHVNTTRLDVWLQHHSITAIDLLWLDTQGHELTILKTVSALLHNIKVIFTEVSFIESYEGQEQYDEVVTWMESHGFIQIARDFTVPGQSLFFGNVLFLRQDLV